LVVDEARYELSPAKFALTFHPVATVLGDGPVTENVPFGFVVTGERPAEPFPLNDMVLPPSPVLVPVAVSVPVTVTFLPQATEFNGFIVRVDGVTVTVRFCGVEFTGE